jgi:hypothetical protein
LPLAAARCSYLTKLQVGDFHETVPSYAVDTSRKNSRGAVKFIVFSLWIINGPEIPILGCIVYYLKGCAIP